MVKIIKSGSIIEIYEYSRGIKNRGGRHERIDGEQEEKNYKSRVIERRNRVRRLACANFNVSTCKFLTLTFDDKKVHHDIRNVQACNVEFKKFIKRLKYYLQVDNLKYLSVIEFQDKNKRGAIHYHCLLDIPDVPFNELSNIWGLGYIFIENVSQVDNIGAYLVKYMTKETADVRLKKEKGYLTSHKLDKPFEQSFYNIKDYRKYKKDVLFNEYGINKLFSTFTSIYETEMLGTCVYTQYNLDRPY